MPSKVVLALAVVGAVVVIILLAVAAVLAVGLALTLLERGVYEAARLTFRLGGGRTYEDDADARESRLPRPPADRVWVELRYLAQCIHQFSARLGYAHPYVDGATRPDLDRLYELREEDWGRAPWQRGGADE